MPIFVGVMSFAVKAVIDKAAEAGDLTDGDIIRFSGAKPNGERFDGRFTFQTDTRDTHTWSGWATCRLAHRSARCAPGCAIAGECVEQGRTQTELAAGREGVNIVGTAFGKGQEPVAGL